MKKNANKFNRIYQGRVQQVSLQTKSGEKFLGENGDDLLFEHHSLFQDAVNYYLVGLTAMALPDEASFFGKMKIQLKTVWEDFYRNGEKRPGLKHSMIRTLGNPERLNAPDGLDTAMRLILDGNPVQPEILNDALEYIAKKCEGDVTQPAKTYFPQLCTKFNGNYDRDAKAFHEAEGKRKLLAALRSESSVSEIVRLSPEMELGWCGIKTKTGASFKDAEAKSSLKKAIQFFIDNIDTSEPVKRYLAQTGKTPLEEYIKRIALLGDISFGRNNKAKPNHRNAMWLLKFFPDEFTVGLMQVIMAKESVDMDEPSKWGDDPIKLSRGKRGYVFRAFSAWKNILSAGRKFDESAFSEALKTVNQFRREMEKRNENLAKYQKALEWMNGLCSNSKPPIPPDTEKISEETDSADALPILAGDLRWDALQSLQKDLGIQNDFTDGELIEYGLSFRTVRGFRKLRNKLLSIEKDGRLQKLPQEHILFQQKKEITLFQTENRDSMGSAVLFQKLIDPQYACIWHDLPNPVPFSSDDILYDAVRYYSYLEKLETLQEPIQITPADPRYSRRCSDLRALSYS